MAGPRPKAHETGPGIFRFLIGDAILECRRNLHDDERFAASIEFALALSEDVIQKHKTWWTKAMVDVLLDENGRPMVDAKGRWLKGGIEIPKTSQYKRLACLTVLLRKAGILDKQAQAYEDATGFFNDVLDSRGGYGNGKTPSPADEEEEEEDGEGEAILPAN